jgi:NADPH:quinone reductase-like Zn-dependent oxidoreductase
MLKTRHRRVIVAERGGPAVLQAIEEAVPEPQPGQVRVRVEAAGVSGLDIMVRSRHFPGFPRPPFTPGVDVVGVVDAVGTGVTGFEEGQRVGALLGFSGGYAEHTCVPQQNAVLVPDGVDPAEAVCVVANYLTAHLAMYAVGNVVTGDRVLIQGAAGGVGTALLELGRMAKLELYGTASASGHELLRGFGATPIDYHTEDFVDRVRSLTGDGVDVVFDPIGGARQLWRSYRSLRPGGRLVWFGVAGSKQHGARVIPASLLMRTMLAAWPDGKRASTTPDLLKHNELYRATLAELFDLLAAGRLDPVIAARIPLHQAAEAHELIERGGYQGKVVLTAGWSG